MRLTLHRVRVSSRTTWWLVELETRHGVGLGECSDAGAPAVLLRALSRLSRHLADRDVLTELDGILAAMAADVRAAHGAVSHATATAMGGLEQSLVDLAAQQAGLPLWGWLGAEQPGPIPVYANINRVAGPRQPADVAAAARAATEAGFASVKCAPFDVVEPGHTLVDIGVARLRAVREAVGEGVGIFADFHEHLTWPEVCEVVGAIAPLHIEWIEDAVPVDAVDRLVELRSITSARIAGGEMLFDAGPALAAVEKGVLDVLMPDVKHAGGVLRARAIAEAAPTATISPHNPSGPVATLAAAHLMAATPRANLLEHAFGEVSWRADIVGGAEFIAEGHLHLSDAPGLGARLDTTHPAVTAVWTTYLGET